MADIELVIKIPEEEYTQIIDKNGIDTMLIPYSDIIRNGTPLPKGHGRLIDTKEFIKSINDWADDIDIYEAYEAWEIAKALLHKHAHTIIEADKEQ